MNASDIKIIRERRMSIALKIGRDGSITVRAPHLIPEYIIRDFINKHSKLIEKNKKRIVSSKSPKKKFVDGEKYMYLGNEYRLQIGTYTSIKIHEDKLLFPRALLFRAEKEIENWYIKEAREKITEFVDEYAKKMNTSYTSIAFSDTKSKWGSCTHDNRLQFTWRLIMAPLLVARYVVIHELSHTMEKNHSHSFWSRVKVFNPSYKEQIKWLRTHGDKIID